MKITKKTIANLTAPKLKELLLETEYKRKLGWNAYFSVRDTDLREALEARDKMLKYIAKLEDPDRNLPIYIVQGFK